MKRKKRIKFECPICKAVPLVKQYMGYATIVCPCCDTYGDLYQRQSGAKAAWRKGHNLTYPSSPKEKVKHE